MAEIQVFGIRHHGPGSAHSLKEVLTAWGPDILLIEGPADGNKVIELAGNSNMQPPIALLIYNPKKPKHAVYFPFAIFSPEWQAMQYASEQGIPARFIDLPQANRLAEWAQKEETTQAEVEPSNRERSASAEALRGLAKAAGFPDHESWWNQMIEQRRERAGIFEAILETMSVLREDAGEVSLFDQQREAYMRKMIRQAKREKFQKIGIVCGAWHAPALTTMPTARHDNELLRGLPRIRVEATWVPWTYGRLSYATGYGAGIQSPGWYQHLWQMWQAGKSPTDMSIHWLTRVAQLLRSEDLDASSAHVIETLRLAETLSAMRDLPMPGLSELNEAVQSVICFGSNEQMKLISKRLIVGEMMGKVPAETPTIPLQRDLHALQRRLRLRPEPEPSTLSLDLRKPMHLERSHLLHRLTLLNIPWGRLGEATRRSKGTFDEIWGLQWVPDYTISVIEASMWGNSVQEAATNFATDLAEKAADLPALTKLLDQIILADLPDTVSALITEIEAATALSNDIPLMMSALPPLVRVLRYGDVRGTDTSLIRKVVDGLVTRICIGLPSSCASLDNDAAEEMYDRLVGLHTALLTLHNEAHLTAWNGTLQQLTAQKGLHGLLAGRGTRLLMDAGIFDPQETARRLQFALSDAKTEPVSAAFWVDGFLRGSGLLLVHDDPLRQIINNWVMELPEKLFITILPLMRRTFATFSRAERRQIGEMVQQGQGQVAQKEADLLNPEWAKAGLPLVGELLGLKS